MKKKIGLIFMAITVMCMFVALLVRCASSDSEPDPTRKYVVFENRVGDEEYTVWGPGTYTVELEYDEEKEYLFGYAAFYTDNDEPTGESSDRAVSIYGNEPGKYTIGAGIYRGKEGFKDYTLEVVIKEKPDLRVDPEVRFDPNGATVEERDGETVYVYQCNYWNEYSNKYQYRGFQFPVLELYYNETKIEMPTDIDGYLYSSINMESGESVRYPYDIGLYRVKYEFYDYSDRDKEKFHGVTVYILVEIRE